MKKKLIIVYLLYLSIITGYIFINYYEEHRETVSAQVYYVDSDMLRLVPVECNVLQDKLQNQAEAIVTELIKGKDKIEKVRRMIPKDRECMSVHVERDTAIVNIKNPDAFPDGRVAENLIVYQIVNSLTSVPGIDKVQFTVKGEKIRDFKGFMDMRETYIADLYV